jgi:hypothetical protein
MKKNMMALLLITLAVFAGGFRDLAAQPPPSKSEDSAKNLVLVEKPEAVPEALAAGFKAITAKDSMAMLSFIASDLLEGRETGTRGFQLAAEYAASLFGLWNINPLGDIPPPRFSIAQFLSGQTFPSRPAERNFLQEFAILEHTETSSRMSLEARSGKSVKTQSFQPGQDYASFAPWRETTVCSPVVFAGYGVSEKDIGYDDFKNLDIKGKIVLILSGAPGRDNAESPFQRNQALKDKYFPPPPAGGITIGTADGQFNKISEIQKRRPAAILQVLSRRQDAVFSKRQLPAGEVSDEQPIINKPSRRMVLPGVRDLREGSPIPLIAITRRMADALLEVSGQTIEELEINIDRTGKPASMEIPGTQLTLESTVKSEFIRGINVVGAIEGSDPALKDEIVVVGAHLDHVGMWQDYIFNGADDNGSGSVGVLNLARAFSAAAQKPKRTIVFCLWCGEEKGLLGSRFFVQNSPLPNARIVAYLNMDMISRPYDEKSLKFAGRVLGFPVGPDFLEQVNPANFLPVLCSAGSGLGEIAREADRYIGLDLYLHDAAGPRFGIGTSDHASFHEEKVPWLFPISAVTENLHQTSDSVDKVSGELIEKASKLMYVIAYRLAER